MLNIATKTIVEQLVDIYRQTLWQDQSVPYEKIVKYYQDMIRNGGVYIIQQDWELLGYYERRFEGDTCFLINVYAIGNGIFYQLYKHFFRTMPLYIKYVRGEKQKLNGKLVKEKISNARR